MESRSTTDLCDAHEPLLRDGRLRVLAPDYLSFGRRPAFAGPAATLRVFEDNVLVRSTLEGPGDGRVLVIDGGGSRRCALVGGNLALLGERSGWAGIIVYGCVRDANELDAVEIGIRALGLHPQRSAKRGGGEAALTVRISDVLVRPGDWIYADRDGVLVADLVLA
jgi:regulator of ribonuclease activity A